MAQNDNGAHELVSYLWRPQFLYRSIGGLQTHILHHQIPILVMIRYRGLVVPNLVRC